MNFTNYDRPLSVEKLSSFKSKYKFQLPVSYEKIILNYNGGYPEKPIYEDFLVYFLPIGGSKFNVETCIESLDFNMLPPSHMPFAKASSCFFVFDTKDVNFPVHVLYEDGEMEKMANSFDAFLDGLEEEED